MHANRSYNVFSLAMYCRYTDYIDCLDRLINAMIEAKSRMIFELLLSVIFQDDNHSHSKAIYDGISRYCAKLNTEEFNETATVCFR